MKPIYLAGPTAVGKSAVALILAERLGAEIISVDSMQVYRGLNIGTAKPSPAELKRLAHHLIDVLDLHEQFDAARFLALATHTQREIEGRGKLPLFCGGTGLYFKTLSAGLDSSPPNGQSIRNELEAKTLDYLLKELAERDPETFAIIDRKNKRRVLRAVETLRLGKPISALERAAWKKAHAPGVWIGLTRQRDDLCQRINARVDEMFSLGLVEETRRLLEMGLAENKTAMQAIGYRQVVEHQRGERSLDQTIELVKQKTRQFAKRQLTWFKGQLNLQWLELAPSETAESTAQRVMDLIHFERLPKT